MKSMCNEMAKYRTGNVLGSCKVPYVRSCHKFDKIDIKFFLSP